MADEPQQIAPSAPDASWSYYGAVYDKRATIGVITALQQKGLQVRVVKNGNRNEMYTRKVS